MYGLFGHYNVSTAWNQRRQRKLCAVLRTHSCFFNSCSLWRAAGFTQSLERPYKIFKSNAVQKVQRIHSPRLSVWIPPMSGADPLPPPLLCVTTAHSPRTAPTPHSAIQQQQQQQQQMNPPPLWPRREGAANSTAWWAATCAAPPHRRPPPPPLATPPPRATARRPLAKYRRRPAALSAATQGTTTTTATQWQSPTCRIRRRRMRRS